MTKLKTRQKKSNIRRNKSRRNKSRRGGCFSFDTIKNAVKGTVAGPVTQVVATDDTDKLVVQLNTNCDKIFRLITESTRQYKHIENEKKITDSPPNYNNYIIIWGITGELFILYKEKFCSINCTTSVVEVFEMNTNKSNILNSIGKYIISNNFKEFNNIFEKKTAEKQKEKIEINFDQLNIFLTNIPNNIITKYDADNSVIQADDDGREEKL